MENKQSALLELYALQQACDGFEYLFSTILYQAAPVIDHDKPAVLLSFATNQRNLKKQWDQYRDKFPLSGQLKFYEIRRTEDFVCVLFYDQAKLSQWFQEPSVKTFLIEQGYADSTNIFDILSSLRAKSKTNCPHEIGIFIGYPPEDIQGFIANDGKNCLHCGYWKVYANADEKIEKFRAYDNARIKMIQTMMQSNDSPFHILNQCQRMI